MTSLLHPPVFRVAGQHANRVLLASEAGATVEIFVLEDDIVRVRVLPDATARNPRTWSIAPGLEDVPLDGRDRLDLSGFALPSFTLVEDDDSVCIETVQIRLAVYGKAAIARGRCATRTAHGVSHSPTVRRRRTTSAGGTIARITTLPASAATRCRPGERAGDSTAPARASRCATSTRWATARSTPTRRTSTFRFTSRGRPPCQGSLFYDTLSDCAFDMGREFRQLSRPVPLFRRRARRSRLLLHRVARHAARGRAALHLAHRAPRAHAEMGPAISFDDALHRCAGRAAADEPVRRTMRHARHPVRFVPPVVGLYIDRREALRVQLEPRQVS